MGQITVVLLGNHFIDVVYEWPKRDYSNFDQKVE